VCEVLRSRTNRIVLAESDGLRQKAQEAFAASGYVEMAHRLGVPIVNMTESPWVSVPCEPGGDVELPRLLLEADVFITLPVLKTTPSRTSPARSEPVGLPAAVQRILLHKHLDPLLATLHRVLQPKLCGHGRHHRHGRPRAGERQAAPDGRRPGQP